jgi:hypothetical protein
MSKKPFDRTEYNKTYYAEHKDEINQRRAKEREIRVFNEQIRSMDFKTWFANVSRELLSYNFEDRSPENILKYNQLIVSAQLMATLKFLGMNEEQRSKCTATVNWINSIPLKK